MKNSLIISFLFVVALLCLLIFFTPYSTWVGYYRGGHSEAAFGNFFTLTEIDFKKLLLEIGVLTGIYFIAMKLLKEHKS